MDGYYGPGTADLASLSRAAFTPCDARESWPAASAAGHFISAQSFVPDAQRDMEFRKPRGVMAVNRRKMFEK